MLAANRAELVLIGLLIDYTSKHCTCTWYTFSECMLTIFWVYVYACLVYLSKYYRYPVWITGTMLSSVSVSAAARSAYSYVSFLLFTEGWTRQRHGSTDTWYLIPHTRMFRFFVHRGGDSTAARQYWYLIPWYLIPLSTRVGKRWQIVWQAPRLGFVARHGKLLVSTPWFRFSSFFWCITFFCYSFLLFLRPNYPGMFPFTSSSCCFVPAAAICSSWVSIMRVVFVSYVFCPISEFLSVYLFYLFHLLFPWLACLLCSRTRYTNLWFAYVRTLVN